MPPPEPGAAEGDAARSVHALRTTAHRPGRGLRRRELPRRRPSFRSCARSWKPSSAPAPPTSRSTSPRPRSTPVRRPTSRRCSTRRSSRSSGGRGSARISASVTTSAGRWPGGRTGRCSTRCSASVSTSWCSSSPTARWPRWRSWVRSPRPDAMSPPASSTSRTPTWRPPTTSPSGSMRCWPRASRPSGSRSSPIAASARHATLVGSRQAQRAGRRPRPGARERSHEEETMNGHSITMLGTGLIGDFYTTTLHAQRSRDRVASSTRDSEPRAAAFAQRWDDPARRRPTWRAAIDHPGHRRRRRLRCRITCTRRRSALAAQAGKAVLCTKPLGRTAEEAWRMLKVVEDGGRVRRVPRGSRATRRRR